MEATLRILAWLVLYKNMFMAYIVNYFLLWYLVGALGSGEPERTALFERSILSCHKKTHPRSGVFSYGGDTQNRTEDKGVADPCLTSWLCRHKNW